MLAALCTVLAVSPGDVEKIAIQYCAVSNQVLVFRGTFIIVRSPVTNVTARLRPVAAVCQ